MTIWTLLGALLAFLVARAFTASELGALLLQPGLWVPLGLLALMVSIIILLRSRYGRLNVTLRGDRLQVAPGWLRQMTSGRTGGALSISEIRWVQALATREGTFLVARAPEKEPLAVPLAHPEAAEVAAALAEDRPQASWDPDARIWATHVVEGPGRLGAPGRQERLISMGLWHMAARDAWSALLSRPEDTKAAETLWALERYRLPTAPRLRLALSLTRLHPTVVSYRLEVARLALAMRLRPLAKEALDDLASRPEAPPVIAHWRACSRERRALPAPPSRATFGIEVNLPHHRLQGDTLVVQGRFRVELCWFVAYSLTPGFWGPPRAFELVDLHGTRHLLRGDALGWAADLSHAAPHLCEVHEVGWLWPPVRRRLAALDRATRGRRPS